MPAVVWRKISNMNTMRYTSVITKYGSIAIVWREVSGGTMVRQILLCGTTPVERLVRGTFKEAQPGSNGETKILESRITRYFEGESVVFDLTNMAMDVCGEFQRKVLLAEYRIPRGWVSTYGRIAAHIGVQGGGRAAGRALATNPFPIVIPCHRAVQSDGSIGGYQGGSDMKRALLEMEGVMFSPKGGVIMEKVYY
jgi:methylated-DNA-[protein]-cysteine S-methyltransferase